jgi:hypothetical protein
MGCQGRRDDLLNDITNERIVKAADYFTIEDDGLQQSRSGNVFLQDDGSLDT